MYTNFIPRFLNIMQDKLLLLVIFLNNQMFLQFYNYKKFDTTAVSFKFLMRNFYFVYLLRVTLHLQ